MYARRLLLIVGILFSQPLFGQSNTMLYDAYLGALLHPETFALHLLDSPALKTPAFMSCLRTAQTNLALIAQRNTAHCERITDTMARQKCKETEEGRMRFVLDAMADAVQGKNDFADSLAGRVIIMNREFLGAELYERLQRQRSALYKEQLMCP